MIFLLFVVAVFRLLFVFFSFIDCGFNGFTYLMMTFKAMKIYNFDDYDAITPLTGLVSFAGI